MSKLFNVGDRVRCIEDGGMFLKRGDILTVRDVKTYYELVPTATPKPTNRFQEGESLKCWIVVRTMRDGSGLLCLTPSSQPVIHRSHSSALAEALRLGTENPDVRFLVFEAALGASAPKAVASTFEL